MPDLPVPSSIPSPARAAKGLKNRPVVIGALVLGVIVTAYLLRRRSTPSEVPATDPNAAIPLPDAAAGSFQGYDQPPYDNTITGAQLLDFITGIREQNLTVYSQQLDNAQELALANLDHAHSDTTSGGPTGGGLPSDPFPNPPPPPASNPPPSPGAPQGATCGGSFPHWNQANGAPSGRSCYRDCGHDECRKHRRVRNHGHCYRDGHRVTLGIESLGGNC